MISAATGRTHHLDRISLVGVIIAITGIPATSFAQDAALREAAKTLAIANICRATYGENQLFDVAFVDFKEIAMSQNAAPEGEIDKVKTDMLAFHTADDTPAMRAVCDLLRQAQQDH